ncbi:MAG: hypothetical protein WAQ98_23585 [Blastocatellia bacterium]
MSNKTKKQLILEIFEQEGFSELNDEAIALVNSRLIETYGIGGKTSAAYIAEILIKAGKTVHYEEQLNITAESENQILLQKLNFDTLADAEQSLLTLTNLLAEFQQIEDREAIWQCQDFVKRARLRAQLIASNPTIPNEKRLIKSEIEFWFEIWLTNPDIFTDWLELRKSSPDFFNKFSSEPEENFQNKEEE